MSEINENNKRGVQGIYANTTSYNAVQTQVNTALQKIETTFLGRIDSCTTSGSSGTGTVNATPLTQMIDGNGNGYKSPSYPALPHYRVQAGIGAFIVNPVAGDIGVFSCTKRDQTNINASTKEQQVPASMRSFSPSDAVMVGTIHTKAPTVWIEIKQDNTIVIHAPAGVTIETDKTVTVNAGTSVEITSPETKINGHLTVTDGVSATGGSENGIKVSGDVVADTVSLKSHTHPNVQSGNSNTGAPNA